MCEQEEFNAPWRIAAGAAGDQCTLGAPEVRHQLQICLVSVETLSALPLPPDAHRCVASIERAFDVLAKGLVANDPGHIADSRRVFRYPGADAAATIAHGHQGVPIPAPNSPGDRGQVAALRRHVPLVWCRALAEQRARHARGEKYAGHAEMCRWLTAWRNHPATAWLAEGPIHPQQQVLRRLDEAYRRFFAKTGGFPSFKRRGEEPGIRFPDPKQFAMDAANSRIKLPKLGWVRLRMSQPVDGVLRNVSITKEGAKWFASIQVETRETVPALGVAPTLGIDMGLAQFVAMSDGKTVAPLKALAKQQVRLKRYQRAVSRKKKGSANRRKAVAKLGSVHRRIAHQRSDWLHKLTTSLADQHPVIALENLRIKNMSASAAGTVDAPGKNVRQKAGLNRGILDAAWGEFARQLTYKVEWHGGRVILVNPAYTSRTCRMCGHESAENRKRQSLFACVACGHTENADVHAAKNILAAGHAVWSGESSTVACGGEVSREASTRTKRAAPVKQEPTEAKVLV